jgi:hypothetical protein
MLRGRIHQNRYRLKTKLITWKFEVRQYPYERGYVATLTADIWLKFHISEGQKNDGLHISEI